jgi:hypothetical protein
MLVVRRLEASGVRVVDMINNRGGGGTKEEEDYWFTPKKVLFYCIIVGLISGTLSIFINSLILLSIAAFVFASITVWYMFGEKFHRWQEEKEKKKKEGNKHMT